MRKAVRTASATSSTAGSSRTPGRRTATSPTPTVARTPSSRSSRSPHRALRPSRSANCPAVVRFCSIDGPLLRHQSSCGVGDPPQGLLPSVYLCSESPSPNLEWEALATSVGAPLGNRTRVSAPWADSATCTKLPVNNRLLRIQPWGCLRHFGARSTEFRSLPVERHARDSDHEVCLGNQLQPLHSIS